MSTSDWKIRVEKLEEYLNKDRQKPLTYLSETYELLDALCSGLLTTQKELMDKFNLSEDGVTSILCSVTKGTQDGGTVLSTSKGGWYEGGPKGYKVNPEFAQEWLKSRGKGMKD